MNETSITSWRHWWWQRVFLPLAVAVAGAYSHWGVWKSRADFTCFLIPFGVVLWSVFLRIRTRRVLVARDSSLNLAVRSWHSLDLFSLLTLAVFETMVLTSACASLLMTSKFLAFSAILFTIYIGLSGFAQCLLISIRGDLANQTVERTGVPLSSVLELSEKYENRFAYRERAVGHRSLTFALGGSGDLYD